MKDRFKTHVEYQLSCRKAGRPGGYVYQYSDIDKILSKKEEYEKRGFICHVKERLVTEWMEVRNASRDDD